MYFVSSWYHEGAEGKLLIIKVCDLFKSYSMIRIHLLRDEKSLQREVLSALISTIWEASDLKLVSSWLRFWSNERDRALHRARVSSWVLSKPRITRLNSSAENWVLKNFQQKLVEYSKA